MVFLIQKSCSIRSLVLGCFATLALALSLAPGNALAQQSPLSGKQIRKITIEGLDKTPESEILGRLHFRIGERYNPEAVEREAAQLFALGKFKRVLGPYESKFEDGVAIRFVVEEKPIVYKVLYLGRDQLSESDFYSSTPSLRLQEGDLFNEYLVEQDRQAIRKKYLDEGFLFVTVDHKIETGKRGAIVSFTISEGSRVQIENIRFSGNNAFSDGELQENMTTKTKGFWILSLFTPGYFKHSDLQMDILNLKKFYRSHGYMDVQIEPSAIEILPEKDGLDIEIAIAEGEQYLFDGYLFTGNTVFSEQVLKDLTVARAGAQFNQGKLDQDKKAVLDYYKDRAYLFAQVSPKFAHSLDKPTMRVRFDIEENNEIHINKIKVKGNLFTQDRVIRRELEFYPGEKIDDSRLVKSNSNLSRLGIFQRIDYSYEPTSQPSYRDVVVNVKELPNFGNIMFGFGLSAGHGIFGNIQLTKKNFDILDTPDSLYDLRTAFTGAGQTLSINLSPGTIWSRYQLTFVEPYLMDTKNSLRLNFRSIKWWRRSWEERHTGFLPSISHAFDFDRDLRARIGARIGNIKVDNVEDDAPQDARDVTGTTDIIGLTLGVEYNKLLYRPYEGPYDGHKETLDYEIAAGFFGSEINFHKIRISQSLVFPVYQQEDGNHHVVALKANLGLIEPFGDTDEIPIFERLFLGGPQNVKGFRYRGMGPHDESGVPIGATGQVWGTVEYGFPVFEQVLRGVVFLDYGNLQDASDFRFEDMRYVLGFGARLNFPLLGGIPIPIGLYFGTPIQREPQDETRFFLFSIGNIF
jgi:outer membrane protein insertion porin family